MYIKNIKEWLSDHKSSTLPGWLSRNPTILEWVKNNTKDYTTKNIMESVYIILNGEPPVCSYGNTRKFNTFDIGYRVGCTNKKCKCVSESKINGMKKSMLERYGVDNANYVSEFNEKRIDTNNEKYGVSYPTKSSEIQKKIKSTVSKRTELSKVLINEKRINTNLERYGVEHHMKLDVQKEKVFSTNIKKYDSKVPLQNPDIRKKSSETIKTQTTEFKLSKRLKTQKTILSKYGVPSVSRIGIPTDILDILDSKEKLSHIISGKTRQEVLKILNIANHTLYLYAKKYDIQDHFLTDTKSRPEKEIDEFVKSLGFTTIIGDRKILNGKEIDIFIPEKNVAIEHCGLYFHTESEQRDKNYHYEKFKNCKEKGIQLITIFGDEWEYKTEVVKRKITNILGMTEFLNDVLYFVKEIESNETKEFIEQYDIQEYEISTVKYGLYHSNNLISVMTFNQCKTHYEIVNVCSKYHDYRLSNILKTFIRDYSPEKIIGYTDNRWDTGDYLEQLGMTKITETINFTYTNHHTRFKIDENIDISKLKRIWDCGQVEWVWAKYNN